MFSKSAIDCLKIKKLLNSNSKLIHTTNVLNAEPLKKKKKTDPTILKLKVERKVNKIKKLIAQLQEQEKIKVPLVELTIDKKITKNLNERTRVENEKTKEINEEFKKLNIVWSLYKSIESSIENEEIKRVLDVKIKTLDKLKSLSPDLYKKSLLIDDGLFPFIDNNMIKETAPIKNYQAKDGVINTVTKEWKIEI